MFKRCSGPELNKSKTEAMWLEKNRPQSASPFDINWPHKCMCLGACFSHDSETSTKDNFEKKLLSLEKCLNIWSSGDLTLYGKINIIKSLALSKIFFVTSVLSIPNGFADQANKLISNFVWRPKPPKIKRSTMIGEIKHEGLKIIKKSLKSSWVKRFLAPEMQSWKIGGSRYLNVILAKNLA